MTRNRLFAAVFSTLLFAAPVAADDGMVTVASPHTVAGTIDRLAAALESKGMTVFTRINHAANATKADLALRPTEVLIFGNPRIGTPLMNCAQRLAIDLPQKMLAYEDEEGQVHLAYNAPDYLNARHGASACDAVFAKVTGALANFAKAATAP
ncbi:MAG: DUF302 domain-containing protein [Pseudomonadota bacterium]